MMMKRSEIPEVEEKEDAPVHKKKSKKEVKKKIRKNCGKKRRGRERGAC